MKFSDKELELFLEEYQSTEFFDIDSINGRILIGLAQSCDNSCNINSDGQKVSVSEKEKELIIHEAESLIWKIQSDFREKNKTILREWYMRAVFLFVGAALVIFGKEIHDWIISS